MSGQDDGATEYAGQTSLVSHTGYMFFSHLQSWLLQLPPSCQVHQGNETIVPPGWIATDDNNIKYTTVLSSYLLLYYYSYSTQSTTDDEDDDDNDIVFIYI